MVSFVAVSFSQRYAEHKTAEKCHKSVIFDFWIQEKFFTKKVKKALDKILASVYNETRR